MLTHRNGAKAKTVLGKRFLRIAPGKRRTVAIKLTRKARRLLAAAGRRGVAAKLSGSGVKSATVRLRK